MALKKPLTPANALYRAAALCSKGEQAESDIRTKLKNWGIIGDEANKIIAHLKQENYLNEERYVKAFCKDKFRFSGWGRIKISYALKQKSISQSNIELGLAEIHEEDYQDTLKKLLKAKLKTVIGKEPIQIKASLVRFAASRGFEPNLIFSLLPQITDIEIDEDSE